METDDIEWTCPFCDNVFMFEMNLDTTSIQKMICDRCGQAINVRCYADGDYSISEFSDPTGVMETITLRVPTPIDSNESMDVALKGSKYITIEEAKNRPGFLIFAKVIENGEKRECLVRMKLDDGNDVCFSTDAEKIVGLVQYVLSDFGTIPDGIHCYVAYVSNKKYTGYKFKDC